MASSEFACSDDCNSRRDAYDGNDPEHPAAPVQLASGFFAMSALPWAILRRIPHDYFDIERVADDLRCGGFAEWHVETRETGSRCQSASDPAIAYCQGTPLRNEIEQRTRTASRK
jgi:hypothetical protein